MLARHPGKGSFEFLVFNFELNRIDAQHAGWGLYQKGEKNIKKT